MLHDPLKILNIIQGVMAVAFFALTAGSAEAEIYKCESAQGKIVYSDTPCHFNATQTVTDIQPDTSISSDNPQSPNKKSTSVLQLDEAIKSAIATGDFDRASALAVNNEQRGWVATAKKGAAPAAAKSKADLAAETSESGECKQAKSDLEREANSSFSKSDVLKAKTSLMKAACGLNDEPDYAQTHVNENVPFLFDTHQRYSNHNLGQWPHKPRPPHTPPETSAPYDRHMEKPFGNNYIRPEETPR
jgi:uncharacterized protein DUF4124